MVLSINTNVAAFSALHHLNASTRQLDETQIRVNSGLTVRNAKDNAAVFAIAQNLRASRQGIDAVKDSLNRNISVLDITATAAEQVQSILIEMKKKVVAAADTLDQPSRDALKRDFEAMRDSMLTVVSNANFNGINIIDGAAGSGLSAIVSPDAVQKIEVPRVNLQMLATKPGGGWGVSPPTYNSGTKSWNGNFIWVAKNTTFTNAAEAQALIGDIDTSIKHMSQALTVFGSGAKAMETQRVFADKVGDSIEVGIGNLVDADMSREAARLQALQTKQQLGLQALGIANQSPQAILSLFGR